MCRAKCPSPHKIVQHRLRQIRWSQIQRIPHRHESLHQIGRHHHIPQPQRRKQRLAKRTYIYDPRMPIEPLQRSDRHILKPVLRCRNHPQSPTIPPAAPNPAGASPRRAHRHSQRIYSLHSITNARALNRILIPAATFNPSHQPAPAPSAPPPATRSASANNLAPQSTPHLPDPEQRATKSPAPCCHPDTIVTCDG